MLIAVFHASVTDSDEDQACQHGHQIALPYTNGVHLPALPNAKRRGEGSFGILAYGSCGYTNRCGCLSAYDTQVSLSCHQECT
jgi:hypothetical protein